jgi:hypothetical protein
MAYLDPSSGSFLLQLLLAALLGGLVFFRSSLGKIKSFFLGLFSRKSSDEEDE